MKLDIDGRNCSVVRDPRAMGVSPIVSNGPHSPVTTLLPLRSLWGLRPCCVSLALYSSLSKPDRPEM